MPLCDERHRVVKLSCSKLARGNQVLIDVIEDMTVKNAQLAVRASIILNNMVMMCVSENMPVPEKFYGPIFSSSRVDLDICHITGENYKPNSAQCCCRYIGLP